MDRDDDADGGRLAALLDRLHQDTDAHVPTSAFGRLRRMAGTALRTARAAKRGGGPGDGLGAADLAAIEKMVLSLGELKGIAMKMGQILSYIDAEMPPETRRLLSLLQVHSQPTPFAAVAAIIREDVPAEADAILAHLDPDPVASASIGQVHRGRLPDGTAVAVKVRHPGIDDAIRADFRAATVGKLMGALMAPGANIKETIVEAQERFLEECDYALEATRQRRFGELFADDPRIAVPAVHDAWCGQRVLTTTWHDGVGYEDWLAADPSADERAAVGRALYDFYVGTLYRHGMFNADPHPGNLVFEPSGRIVVLDYGCVRAFDGGTVRSLAALSQAVRDDVAPALRDAMVGLGARDPGASGKRFDATRTLLRAFFGPVMEPGPHVITAGASIDFRESYKTKRAIFRLRVPGKLLFLYRIRFGLYAILSRIGARADWREIESQLTDAALGSGR
ncbi:MAG: AarF/ABC1/UbiB kinase family protein [Deltaproteobacteria bacterium]|nr:MAG: AarF/ABC1/UbiB kinase family protein [Deltaproteobacteria bacterium]